MISDYNMPQFSGLDLARELHLLRPDLPMIISSGYVSDNLRSAARSNGGLTLLNKEDTYDKLVGLVAQALART